MHGRVSGNAPAEAQYEGLFRGLGVSSAEPICGKRKTELKTLHGATHFAVGCKKWDEGSNKVSTAQASYVDPQVVYAVCDAPDKNASVVDLTQRQFDPQVHYRTEQRERYQHPGSHQRDPIYRAEVTIHLGDDRPELITQSKMVHGRITPERADRAAMLRAAGSGTLIPTSYWPKPVRCDPITGGARKIDIHDLGVASGVQFPRLSQNSSNIVMEANVRNPLLGYHTPLEDYSAPRGPGASLTSKQAVEQANAMVPPLRSLGALRPPI